MKEIWKFPPRNLLIRVVPQQPDSKIVIEKNPLDSIARHWTIFGNWTGLAKPGTTYAFDSFLLPNEVLATEASDLAAQVKSLAPRPHGR